MTDPTDEIRRRAEQIIGYTFNDSELLAKALTHASVTEARIDSNERMEFLGDALFGAVVCEHLFREYDDLLEGHLTKIKSAVVSRRTCAEVSDEIGLTDLLTLGKGIGTRADLPSSLAAAVYESVVAAIYLDGGHEPMRAFILRTIGPIIEDIAESDHQHNFKSVLQQHAQKNTLELPVYRLLDEKGPDHSKAFEVCVDFEGTRHPSAWGGSKKEAEQSAALNALTRLGIADIDSEGEIVIDEGPSTESSDAPVD